MTSSVTVWTSPSTTHAQARAAYLIEEARAEGAPHDDISLAGRNVAECRESLESAFKRLVSLTMTDSTLHILAVTPLYEEDSTEQLRTLTDACASLDHNITVHILGLTPALRPLFEAKKDIGVTDERYAESLSLLKSLCENSTFNLSYSLIDDYAENGASIGFTIESLARYIATIQIALMRDYYSILSPAMLTAHAADNLSIGVATLSFDRKAACRQLLGMGFMEALENVGINNTVTDAQKAARHAEEFLTGISERHPALFENSIRPLFKDGGLDEGTVVARAADILDKDMAGLKASILAFLYDPTHSLPEKEAILALILGRDNENIRGMQYDHEGTLLDDACEVPINLYVDAYNRCCSGTRLLPVRGDFPGLKKFIRNSTEEEYIEDPGNFSALNPLPFIKRLKQTILNDTSYIRKKQDELDDLLESSRQRENAEEIREKWHKPEGSLKDVEYKEQPLDERYSPAPGLKIKPSVDLRKYFTPVKNQMDLGSCTSFAAAAMYEAMMALAGVEGQTEMSPGYLYFYSNVLKGRPSGGSNFMEQLEVLGSHGICRNDLYTYVPDTPQSRPSEEADKDAQTHRVLSAKQIPLYDEPDKAVTLKHNHQLLTAALSEGYPVGISLRVYDNLGKDGAFILHPADNPEAVEEGWHAMVVVGYSEENACYIVRNSWGREFGEDGYCYIPASYIDDPEYMNFACIITSISDNAGSSKADIPVVLANFAATETEIRIAALRNVISRTRTELQSDQRLYAEYYRYYQRLMTQLTAPKVQKAIRTAAEKAQGVSWFEADAEKRALENSFVEKLDEFKRQLCKAILSAVGVTIGIGLWLYLSKGGIAAILFLIAATITILAILGYKWMVRKKRRELREEVERATIYASKQKEKLLEMQIRFHVAGMWLSRFHDLSLELGNVYDRLVSYNMALRVWQTAYSRQVGAPEKPKGEMFRTINATPLLRRFFESNKTTIVRGVDLIEIFNRYQINPAGLESTRLNLQDTVSSVIGSLMADFNITDYLLGEGYQYLPPIDLQKEISTLISVGQPSYRNPAMNATTPVRILIAPVHPEREPRWRNRISPLFPMLPIQLSTPDTTTLILLTLHPISA